MSKRRNRSVAAPEKKGGKNALAENRQTTEKSLHFLPFILGDANARLRQSVVHDLRKRRRRRRMEGSYCHQNEGFGCLWGFCMKKKILGNMDDDSWCKSCFLKLFFFFISLRLLPLCACTGYLFENEVQHQRVVEAVLGIKNLSEKKRELKTFANTRPRGS